MTDGASPDTNESVKPQGPDVSAKTDKNLRISRRTFLKGAAALGGLTALAGTLPTNFYGIFDIRREETNSEQEVEDKFGVEILSAVETHNILGRTVLSRPKEEIFDEEQLQMIKDFLPLLPSRFYGSHDGNKLNLAAVKEGFVKGMRRGSFTTAKGPWGLDNKPLLMLVDNFFQPVRKGFAFRVFAHELTHRVNYELTENHVLWGEVNSILGYEKFSDFRDSMLPILDQIPPDSDVARNVRNWLGYALKGADGIGKDIPDELLGVLGGAYVGGREDFDPIAIWLGQETTDRLYGFMRDKVFDGREYNGDQRPAFLDKSSYKD